ncbi:START domain-containing protein [Tanacetum coccineum]
MTTINDGDRGGAGDRDGAGGDKDGGGGGGRRFSTRLRELTKSENNDLWIKSEEGRDVLVQHLFKTIVALELVGLQSSRASALVKMDHFDLAVMLAGEDWRFDFPHIVAKEETIRVLPPGKLEDTSDGTLLLDRFVLYRYFSLHQLVSRAKVPMFPRRSEGKESEYPFFEGDGSSCDEWRDYGMAGDDYEGPLVDDQYEEESMPVYNNDSWKIVSGIHWNQQIQFDAWVVAEISHGPSNNFRRLPSGCLIQSIAEDLSKVGHTWVEHMEVKESMPNQTFYAHLIRSGFTFGAERMVAWLERSYERWSHIDVTSDMITKTLAVARKEVPGIWEKLTLMGFGSGMARELFENVGPNDDCRSTLWRSVTGSEDMKVYVTLYRSPEYFEVAGGVVAFCVKHYPEFVLEMLGDERIHHEEQHICFYAPMATPSPSSGGSVITLVLRMLVDGNQPLQEKRQQSIESITYAINQTVERVKEALEKPRPPSPSRGDWQLVGADDIASEILQEELRQLKMN